MRPLLVGSLEEGLTRPLPTVLIVLGGHVNPGPDPVDLWYHWIVLALKAPSPLGSSLSAPLGAAPSHPTTHTVGIS